MSVSGYVNRGQSIHPSKDQDAFKDGVLTVSQDNLNRLDYPQWAPTWDPKQSMKFKDEEPFSHTDRGYFGDPSFDSLFKDTGATTEVITPKLGTVVHGLQLSQLTDRQKDDLALLIEQRGVVAFRDQDFKNLSFDELKKWGRYYGPLHVHPTSGAPKDQPEFHLTFRRGEKDEYKREFARNLNSIAWHTDVSYENQPPGITLLVMLQTGKGGDTQFIDTIEAYDRLSPTLKDFIDNLKVLHTSRRQANSAKSQGGVERKIPNDAIHPLVRYHPVLKKKALYVSGFASRILGLKDEESDALLTFLNNHVNTLLDAHIRPSWDANTVVLWDNRRLIHTATLDWDSDDIRHSFRITPLAERPVASEEELNTWTPEKEKKDRKRVEEDLSLTPEEYYNKFYAGAKKNQ